VKKGDIVTFELNRGKMAKGSVNWVDGANAGITMLGKEYHFANEYVVMPVEDCEVMTEHKDEALKKQIHKKETEELKAAILRLKGMRFPRKMKGRFKSVSASPSRRQKLTKLLDVIDNDPGALDTLISKALEEGKEEKK